MSQSSTTHSATSGYEILAVLCLGPQLFAHKQQLASHRELKVGIIYLERLVWAAHFYTNIESSLFLCTKAHVVLLVSLRAITCIALSYRQETFPARSPILSSNAFLKCIT